MQFMKEGNPIDAQFVFTAAQQKVIWITISMQFMKEKDPINAQFVIYCCTAKLFEKAHQCSSSRKETTCMLNLWLQLCSKEGLK